MCRWVGWLDGYNNTTTIWYCFAFFFLPHSVHVYLLVFQGVMLVLDVSLWTATTSNVCLRKYV